MRNNVQMFFKEGHCAKSKKLNKEFVDPLSHCDR